MRPLVGPTTPHLFPIATPSAMPKRTHPEGTAHTHPKNGSQQSTEASAKSSSEPPSIENLGAIAIVGTLEANQIWSIVNDLGGKILPHEQAVLVQGLSQESLLESLPQKTKAGRYPYIDYQSKHKDLVELKFTYDQVLCEKARRNLREQLDSRLLAFFDRQIQYFSKVGPQRDQNGNIVNHDSISHTLVDGLKKGLKLCRSQKWSPTPQTLKDLLSGLTSNQPMDDSFAIGIAATVIANHLGKEASSFTCLTEQELVTLAHFQAILKMQEMGIHFAENNLIRVGNWPVVAKKSNRKPCEDINTFAKPNNSSNSKAFRYLIKHPETSKLECNAGCAFVRIYSMLLAFGDNAFDQLFPDLTLGRYDAYDKVQNSLIVPAYSPAGGYRELLDWQAFSNPDALKDISKTWNCLYLGNLKKEPVYYVFSNHARVMSETEVSSKLQQSNPPGSRKPIVMDMRGPAKWPNSAGVVTGS